MNNNQMPIHKTANQMRNKILRYWLYDYDGYIEDYKHFIYKDISDSKLQLYREKDNLTIPDKDSFIRLKEPVYTDIVMYSINNSEKTKRIQNISEKPLVGYKDEKMEKLRAYCDILNKGPIDYNEWKKKCMFNIDRAEELYQWLYDRNFIEYSNGGTQAVEIPIHTRIFTVECQVERWQKALANVQKTIPYTNMPYIAIDKNRIDAVNKDKVKESGIGMLSVGEDYINEVIETEYYDRSLESISNRWKPEKLDINEKSMI